MSRTVTLELTDDEARAFDACATFHGMTREHTLAHLVAGEIEFMLDVVQHEVHANQCEAVAQDAAAPPVTTGATATPSFAGTAA